MTRDTRTRIQKAARFFARLESFALECPNCGRVYYIRPDRRSPAWEPRLARFTCASKYGCDKVYVLGILAWPLQQTAKVATQTPRDQVPTPRQALELRRQHAGGWWLSDEDRQKWDRPEVTNLTPDEGRPRQTEEDEDFLDGLTEEEQKP